MTVHPQAIEKFRKAYQVLDVAETASALAIKSNYRKLIKRWHPDKPATNAATQAEATMMTKLINEAYALIENAPLRYYGGQVPNKRVEKTRAETAIHRENEVDLSKMFFNEKRIEYAVRIVCGALAGAFVGLAISLDGSQKETEIVVAISICAIGFAVGALKYGDKFWRVVFGKWWMWG